MNIQFSQNNYLTNNYTGGGVSPMNGPNGSFRQVFNSTVGFPRGNMNITPQKTRDPGFNGSFQLHGKNLSHAKAAL